MFARQPADPALKFDPLIAQRGAIGVVGGRRFSGFIVLYWNGAPHRMKMTATSTL